MPEEKPIVYMNVADHVEISQFDDDPDGEPDRAGDGYYFQIEGDEDWSGAYHSEEDAESEAKYALELREWNDIVKEMVGAGFSLTSSGGIDIFEKKIDDEKYLVRVEEDVVVLGREADQKYEVLNTVDIEDAEGIGHSHKAVREVKHLVLEMKRSPENRLKM